MIFYLFAVGVVLELALYSRGFWRIRQTLAVAALLITTLCTSLLLAGLITSFSVTLLLISLINSYRLVNLLRVIKGRMHEAYLRRAAWRSSVVLISLEIGVGLLWLLWQQFSPTNTQILTSISALQLLAASLLLLSAVRSFVKTRPQVAGEHLAVAELPSVTVAIPARNETADLAACLTSVLASDYPKLEVLVLDDCSQDKTSEVIKSFAHRGVRFVLGEPPAENWLAKNQAYSRLAEEATGEYLLFSGVDVRFAPQAIRALVGAALIKQKQMMCVLPRQGSNSFIHCLIQPMRYFWELAFPRRLFNRPPVLSTCWLTQKRALERAGGFAAVNRSIVPEAYFAHVLIQEDSYSFVRSSVELDIVSVKQFSEQWNTALRTRYPQLRRRLENVLLFTLAEAIFLLGPFGLFTTGLRSGSAATILLSGLAVLALLSTHYLILLSGGFKRVWAGVLTFPIAVLLEIGLLNESMRRYEFSEVIWKGRNICLPVMHTIPRLPAIPER